jgi:hypothetical protein
MQLLWKAIWRSLKKIKTELPYNPVISLLGIYQKECISGYDRATCTPMFIAALFTIVKFGSRPHAPKLMNGLRKCGIHTQWSFT